MSQLGVERSRIVAQGQVLMGVGVCAIKIPDNYDSNS
jgi:hypothetical protein